MDIIERNSAIVQMRLNGSTFGEIARKFNFTSANAAYIFKKYNGTVPSDEQKELMRKIASIRRCRVNAKRPEYSYGDRHRTVSHGLGKFGEDAFEDVCSQLGISCERMSESNPFDFLVNGKRIEIKTSFCGDRGNGKWSFGFQKNVGEFDYLVLCGIHANIPYWLVVPSSEVADSAGITVWPFSDTKLWEKLSSYINRFDLIF